MNVLTTYLEQFYDELFPKDFYRYIFPVGELDTDRAFTPGKYTGILIEVLKNNKVNRYTLTDDLHKIDTVLKSNNFCLTSPISYAGKSRSSQNSRYLYALAFDLDGVIINDNGKPQGLIDLFYQIEGPSQRLPRPTLIVSSGTGLHLYYVFEKPIPLFKNIVKQLQIYKRRMTEMIWQGYITTLEDNIQQESVFQGFRMPGTITKLGDRARAFQTGERVSIEYLNSFVDDKYKLKDFGYSSTLNINEAQKKYPEWYQKRVIENQPRGKWKANKAVYEWWKREILSKARVGHRYYCMMMLAVYARKCGITFNQLEKDAFLIMYKFDKLTDNNENHFDESDTIKALEAYNDSYITYPINSISYLTDISIKKNKRNGRKQEQHLQFARGIRELKAKMGENVSGGGRPSAEKTVRDYQQINPNAKPKDIMRGTGLSKNTVYKYYKK